MHLFQQNETNIHCFEIFKKSVLKVFFNKAIITFQHWTLVRTCEKKKPPKKQQLEMLYFHISVEDAILFLTLVVRILP